MDRFNEELEIFKSLYGITTKKPRTSVQSVICSKSRFKTVAAARGWCKSHKFKSGGVDETEESYRFRQFEPTRCQEGSFRTVSLTDGVSAVVCRPKGQGG